MNPRTLMSNVVAVLSVLVGGFVLFNGAFLVYAVLVNLPDILAGQGEAWTQGVLGTLLLIGGSAIALGCAVWYLVEKKLRTSTLLATLLTAPLMTALVLVGITLYGQADWVIGLTGVAIIVPILAYCVWKKLPWVYALAVVYVGILGVVILLFDVQI